VTGESNIRNPSEADPEPGIGDRQSARDALLAGFLGWTLDAFDFFILAFVLAPIAAEFKVPITAVAAAFGASLATRWVGALIFGLIADRYGRRLPLMLDVLFYSVIEVLSGLAPSYRVFFALRLLYGIGMGGEWGVGASLAMESVPVRWRGVLSGLLQEGYPLGSLLAALVYNAVFPHWGWRPLFFIGGLPALLTLFIRRRVKEPEAWRRSRTDWAGYRRAVFGNWRMFLYLVVLMTIMNLMSHGTQDMYPTFLVEQRRLSPHTAAIISAVSMVGAILGGLVFGLFSDRRGRRRAMITATVLGLVMLPLWILAPSTALIVAGAFLMQFMVQGAWGVIPAHLNELSPNELRGFFPGFTYQLGVVASSSIAYIEATLARNMGYAQAMGLIAAVVLVAGTIAVGVGPEAKGATFGKTSEV